MANYINFNDDDKNKDNGAQSQSGSQSAAITPVGAFNAQQSVPQAQSSQPASSGQFTNIQKYLQANKGAGQQVANSVNNQMDKSLQAGKTSEQDATKQFQAGVQNANNVLNRGQGYSQQLQAPVQQTQGIIGSSFAPTQPGTTNAFGDTTNGPAMNQQQAMNATGQGIQPVSSQQAQPFNPGNIVNNADTLKDFTNIRTGGAINEDQLGTQANTAQTIAGSNQTDAQNLVDQSKTAIGRNALIGSAFNRPNYTQGQQRLDSLFLTGAGKQGINAVQDKANTNYGQATNVYNQDTAGVNQAGQVKTQDQQLQSDLQNRANSMETGYVSNLESLVPEVNNMRADEKARWQNNFDIMTGKKQGQMDQDIFNEFQLRNGEHSFGVLNDPNLSLGQIAQLSDRNATGAQDVASQKDVDYYNMLAKLSKGTLDSSGNFVGPSQDQLKLTQASDLGRAAQSNTGDNSLRNMLNTAQGNFIQNALNRTVTGTGTDTGQSGLFGGGSDANVQLQQNLAQYLNSQGINSADIMTGSKGVNSAGQNVNNAVQGLNLLNPETLPNQALAQQFNGLGSFAPGQEINLGMNAINGMTGAGSGSTAAATARAQSDLLSQLNSVLQGSGYNNYVTMGGNKNVDDLANKISAQNIDALDMNRRYAQRNDDTSASNLNLANPYLGDNKQQNQAAQSAYSSGILNSGYNAAQLQNLRDTDFNKYLDISRQYGGEGATEARDIYSNADRFNQALQNGQQLANTNKANAQSEYDSKMNSVNAAKQSALNEMIARLGTSNFTTPGVANNNVNLNDTSNGPAMTLQQALAARLAGK